MSQSRHISVEELDKALDCLACIIDAYGDQYWPIYEALEKEYERKLSQRQKLQDRIEKIRQSQNIPNEAA